MPLEVWAVFMELYFIPRHGALVSWPPQLEQMTQNGTQMEPFCRQLDGTVGLFSAVVTSKGLWGSVSDSC